MLLETLGVSGVLVVGFLAGLLTLTGAFFFSLGLCRLRAAAGAETDCRPERWR